MNDEISNLEYSCNNTSFCILAINSKDVLSFLVETYSVILTENSVLTAAFTCYCLHVSCRLVVFKH